jgi:hypothetical protein
MVHHYWLEGNAGIFAEDSVVEVPLDVGHTVRRVKKSVVLEDGTAVEKEEDSWEELPDREGKELEYYSKNYEGWTNLGSLVSASQTK